jgi:hypothetical protein
LPACIGTGCAPAFSFGKTDRACVSNTPTDGDAVPFGYVRHFDIGAGKYYAGGPAISFGKVSTKIACRELEEELFASPGPGIR